LKCKCIKWVCMTHLDIYSTSYGKKERPGVKLTIRLPTIKSRESTQPLCVQVECNTPLESSQWELQLFFRPHPNQRSEQKSIILQSCKSPNRGSFGTPLWESRDKKPFGCKCHGEAQRILYGGRWWLLLSLGRLVSPKSLMACPSTKGALESELTNLLVDLMHIRMSN
jgi:hypothetical protein